MYRIVSNGHERKDFKAAVKGMTGSFEIPKEDD